MTSPSRLPGTGTIARVGNSWARASVTWAPSQETQSARSACGICSVRSGNRICAVPPGCSGVASPKLIVVDVVTSTPTGDASRHPTSALTNELLPRLTSPTTTTDRVCPILAARCSARSLIASYPNGRRTFPVIDVSNTSARSRGGAGAAGERSSAGCLARAALSTPTPFPSSTCAHRYAGALEP